MPTISGLVFLLALWAIHSLVSEISYRQLMQELSNLTLRQWLLAVLATLTSFVALTGYDWSALKYLDMKLPYRTVALGSFCGYAISNAVGLTLISGTSVRYRLYSQAGLSGMDVTRITAFCALSFGIGLHVVGGFSLLLHPELLSQMTHLSPNALRSLGGLMLFILLTLFVYGGRRTEPLRLLKWNIQFPSLRLTFTQLLITLADIVGAGLCLYVLLPPSEVPFPAFMLVFSVACAAGVASHVPGGMGVFEGVILLTLKDYLSVEQITAALLGYRGVYFLGPLLVAMVLLVGREILDRIDPQATLFSGMKRWMGQAVPPLVAAFSLVSGVVLLISSATPAIPERLEILQDWLPLIVVETSHSLSAVVGFTLLVLSHGLYRRLNGAYFVTLILCAVGILLSLAKGIDYEEALVLFLLGVTLYLNRDTFYRRTALTDSPLNAAWKVMIISLVASMVWLILITFREVEYTHNLWIRFDFDAEFSRSLRASLAVLICAFGLALRVMLKAPAPTPEWPDEAILKRAEAIIAHQDSTLAHLALMGDKHLLFAPDDQGFLMYGVRGASWIALGDPVGEKSARQDLAWMFRERVDRQNGRVAFYQVRPELLPLYLDMDLLPLKLGEEAIAPLAEFTIEGGKGADFRQALRRGERDGLSFEIIGAGQFQDYAQTLRAVSDDWLTSKNTAEKGFSLGAFEPRYLMRCPIALVRKDANIVAFANLLMTQTGQEVSIDLMRHSGEAPKSTMQYLFIQLMLYFKAQGHQRFNLGMAPLSGLEHHPLAPLWHRFGSMLYNRGESYYNFQGLRHFKEKFDPVWEPRYLVSQGGLNPALTLTDVAALIAGGYRAMLSK